MSDKPTNQPPVDAHLPDGLAACASILARRSLPSSRVNRDELLYRAGWAAAEVHAIPPFARGADQKQASGATGRRSTVAWCVASAVITASLTIAITMRLRPADDTPANSVVDLTRADDAADSREVTAPDNLAHPVPEGFAAGNRIQWTASLLIMRDRAILQKWDDPWIAGETSFGASPTDDGDPQPNTSREMLKEFLPAAGQDTSDSDSMPRQIRWPWTTIRSGETT